MKVLINDKVDYYQKLENSEFTVKWLLESLKKNDKKYLKLYGNRGVKEVITKDISDGKGLFSIICRATIIFTDSVDESDTYSTILKIPGFSGLEKSLQQCGSDKWFDESYKQKLTYLHDIECDFYTSVSSIIDIPIPKIYNTVEWIYEKQEGCIHMEDLTNLGKTISYFDNINLTQVKCFIQHLAHWHKNILCTDPKLWKGKYSKKSTNFNRGNIPFQKLGESFAQNLPSKDRLIKYLEKFRNCCYNLDQIIAASKLPLQELDTVIVHGDMYFGNIMWAIDAEGDIQNDIVAFIDWQTMREGSPMEDLARFLILCADGIVRRQAEEFAIQYYFDCLITEFGNIKKVPYSMAQLEKAYKYAFIIESMKKNGLGVVPFFLGTVNDKKIDKSVKDAFRDYGILKVLHLYEDVDKLLMNEMKDIYDQFGN